VISIEEPQQIGLVALNRGRRLVSGFSRIPAAESPLQPAVSTKDSPTQDMPSLPLQRSTAFSTNVLVSPRPASSSISLGIDLWFHPPTATLIYQGQSVLLTKREDAVLKILLKSPHAWHTSSSLAHKLKRLCTVPIEPHSIEQTICGLRRKLGESGKRQHILQSHYGHGYRIVPGDDSADQQALPATSGQLRNGT
jgi:DNA-binding winged helix-turn-helix (wHTH) protein